MLVFISWSNCGDAKSTDSTLTTVLVCEYSGNHWCLQLLKKKLRCVQNFWRWGNILCNLKYWKFTFCFVFQAPESRGTPSIWLSPCLTRPSTWPTTQWHTFYREGCLMAVGKALPTSSKHFLLKTCTNHSNTCTSLRFKYMYIKNTK